MTAARVGAVGARVDRTDWTAIAAELDEYGCALTPQLLTSDETGARAGLYAHDERFRSTIDMGRYRFGSGEYRHFERPFPEPIEALKQALYPRLLPIARSWWSRLGRETPWPDTLDEWLAMCHAAGQTKATPILLRYGTGDWNALHRDLYGDLVFPLQMVINLSEPGVDHTGVSSSSSSSARARSRAAPRSPFRTGTGWCSRPAIVRSRRSAGGRRHLFGTASRRCAPGGG